MNKGKVATGVTPDDDIHALHFVKVSEWCTIATADVVDLISPKVSHSSYDEG